MSLPNFVNGQVTSLFAEQALVLRLDCRTRGLLGKDVQTTKQPHALGIVEIESFADVVNQRLVSYSLPADKFHNVISGIGRALKEQLV
jgi:hypothetical protein